MLIYLIYIYQHIPANMLIYLKFQLHFQFVIIILSVLTARIVNSVKNGLSHRTLAHFTTF